MPGNGANGEPHDGAADSQPNASTSTQGGTSNPEPQAPPQGQPTVTLAGNGISFSGDVFAGQNVGNNGIQMKWPEHPGEYGLKGAEKHKRWKNDIKTVMFIKGIDEKTAALLTKMYAQGHAKKMLERIEFDDLVWSDVCEMLDTHFGGDPDDEAKEAENVFRTCARRYGEPMREYLIRLEFVKQEYLRTEVGSAVAPRAYAEQMLRRSGLSRFDQRAVFSNCNAKWDAAAIKQQLETVYRNVEGNDKSAAQKGRNFRRGKKKVFITGVTSIEPDDVESSEGEEEQIESSAPGDWNSQYDNSTTDWNGTYILNGVDGNDPSYYNEPNLDEDDGYDGEDGYWYYNHDDGCVDIQTLSLIHI